MITKDNAKQWLPLVQAMAEGKAAQVDIGSASSPRWVDADTVNTDTNPRLYRPKPDPVLRPWKPEEAPKVFVVLSRDGKMCVATLNGETVVVVGHAFHHEYDLQSMADHWTLVCTDGSNRGCGILEETT